MKSTTREKKVNVRSINIIGTWPKMELGSMVEFKITKGL